MGLLPDTSNCGLRMRLECWEHCPRHQLQRKALVSDAGMHHGTCMPHVPWCMPGSLTCGDGENVPGIPGACATRNFTYLVRGPLWSGLKTVNTDVMSPNLAKPYDKTSDLTLKLSPNLGKSRDWLWSLTGCCSTALLPMWMSDFKAIRKV